MSECNKREIYEIDTLFDFSYFLPFFFALITLRLSIIIRYHKRDTLMLRAIFAKMKANVYDSSIHCVCVCVSACTWFLNFNDFFSFAPLPPMPSPTATVATVTATAIITTSTHIRAHTLCCILSLLKLLDGFLIMLSTCGFSNTFIFFRVCMHEL